MAVSTAVPSTMAASTTWPRPEAERSWRAASTPTTSSMPPPPKSPSRFRGGAGGPLHAQDGRPEVGKQHAGEGGGPKPRQLEHAKSGERSHGGRIAGAVGRAGPPSSGRQRRGRGLASPSGAVLGSRRLPEA